VQKGNQNVAQKQETKKVGSFWGLHWSQGTVSAHELIIGTEDHGTNGDRVPWLPEVELGRCGAGQKVCRCGAGAKSLPLWSWADVTCAGVESKVWWRLTGEPGRGLAATAGLDGYVATLQAGGQSTPETGVAVLLLLVQRATGGWCKATEMLVGGAGYWGWLVAQRGRQRLT
jgi:hypothetical protein